MKLLFLDIETSPNLVDTWGIWQQNVAISQIHVASYSLCWAASWQDSSEIVYHRNNKSTLKVLWKMLDEADVVVHYNGKKFDMPHINREFVEAGLPPPSPYRQIDLLQVVRRQFKFVSNKLDYVAPKLGCGKKIKHPGHSLWVRVLAGDEKAWCLMERYNRGDVKLLKRLYKRLMPWIPRHPNRMVVDAKKACCPACGSNRMEKRGTYHTNACEYQRYRCNSCFSWSRGSVNMGPTPQQKRMAL